MWTLIAKYLLIPLLVIGGTITYKKWPSIRQDNAIEEFLEDKIEENLGVDIDISPESPEEVSNDNTNQK